MLFIRKSRVRLVKQIQVDNSVCFQSIAGSSKYRKLCQYTSRRMYRILPRSSKRWSELQLKRPLSMLLYPSSWRFCHIEVHTLFLDFTSLSQLQNGCQIFGYLANKMKQPQNSEAFWTYIYRIFVTELTQQKQSTFRVAKPFF